MLRLNAATINPVSGGILAATWIAGGVVAGTPLGALAARGARIVRIPPPDAALFLATLGVGHLLLPLGLGMALAAGQGALRVLRRLVLPRHARLDAFLVLALAVVTSEAIAPDPGARPPRLAGPPAAGTPAPGAVPVSITVRPRGPFPEVAATHARCPRLDSDAPGLDAAIRTGRLPIRTGAGPSHPRAVPGGGGIACIPHRPGSRALARLFPEVASIEGTPFAPSGTVDELARAAGLPVLTGWPAPDDPPLFLRWLPLDAPPDEAQARALAETGAWIDVEYDGEGGEIALAGRGVSARASDAGASLLDAVPTALHVLGLAVPRECDGRVLVERLADPGPAERPVRYRPLAPDARSSGAAASAAAPSRATTSR